MRRIIPIAALAGAAAFIAVAAAPGQQPATGTAHGVYTEDQASQGAALYAQACTMCHGATLDGTYEIPALKGRFMANWGRGSVGALFDYVSNAMPQHAPGSLSAEDNAKIVAYLLKANGMPAGTRPLPSDPAALNAIPFETVRPR